MIGNIVQGKDFGDSSTYLLSKSGASLVAGNMSGRDIEGITQEFEFARSYKPDIKNPVFHVSLSLMPEENLEPASWQILAERYMAEMNLRNNQYIGVRHTDRPHDHIHLLVNKIQLDGSVSSLWQSKRRTETVLRQLEKDFSLQTLPSSWERDRDRAGEHHTRGSYQRDKKMESFGDAEFIRSAINSALTQVADLQQLREYLRQSSIELRERKKDGVTIGISYRFAGRSIAGYRLGSQYTWAKTLCKLYKSRTEEQAENINNNQNKTLLYIPEISELNPPIISVERFTNKKLNPSR